MSQYFITTTIFILLRQVDGWYNHYINNADLIDSNIRVKII